MPVFKMKNGLGEIRLKYLVEDMDRHGNMRIYIRRKGKKKIRMFTEVGTQNFLDEYHYIIANKRPMIKPDAQLGSPRAQTKKESMAWLCSQYIASAKFKLLSESTRKVRRRILDRICEKHGKKPFAQLEPRHIRMFRDAKTDRQGSANNDLKVFKQLFGFAVEYDLAKNNPAKEVPYFKPSSEGFHSWTPEEVQQFERHFSIGTKARLAFSLLLYTGQRRSDVVKLSPRHAKDSWLSFTQEKNRNRKPVKLSIPILPELQHVLDNSKTGHTAFLLTQSEKPFTSNGFGNWFRKRCDEAGLPQCSAHGLRKAGATRAAENGATDQQLMAMFGWVTSKQVIHYTRSANQKTLAESGMKLLASNQ